MAWHLVRLKIALLRNGIKKGGRGALVGEVLTLLVALGTGAVIGLGLTSLRAATPEVAADVAAGVFAVLFVFWVLGPILALASDGTLDVDRLALFPLSPRQLMPGLLAGAAVGAGGVFTFLVLFGTFLGTAPTGVGGVAVLLACGLAFALMLATSRLVSTALSAAAGKRRWRDLALFLGPVLALAIQVGIQIFNRTTLDASETGRVREPDPATLNAIRDVIRWLPTGWASQAIYAADDGRVLPAALGLAATAALVVVVLRLWWRAIQAATTNPTERSVRRPNRERTLIPRAPPRGSRRPLSVQSPRANCATCGGNHGDAPC